MPFYKWVIETKNLKQKDSSFYSLNNDEIDVDAVANRRMVQVIKHLSQLARIAHDIFGGIEDECMNINERTRKLRDNVRKCQDIVDNLNAKTVSIPVSTLTGEQTNSQVQSPVFSKETDHLHSSNIPSTSIDEDQTTDTHVYCQPLDQYSKTNMTTLKVPSSVVPIDVNSQPFSRMASFRRSLIHGDFFTRRKKKTDKRRNTVTEGDAKNLEDAFHNILKEKPLCPVETIINKENKKYNYEHNHNIQLLESSTIKIANEEKNNNSDKKMFSDPKINNSKLEIISDEKNKMNALKKENVIFDSEQNYKSENKRSSLFSKKRTKGHIPISTVSAAMSVAVEMRQLNEQIQSDQSSSGNWSYSSEHNSSDSENRRNSTENKKSEIFEVESNNSTVTKESINNRLRDGSTSAKNFNIKKYNKTNETENLSCASSESNGINDDASNATSTESEFFFISSDESDEDISDLIFEPNYGSSLSITTASNDSLNSLLSQTGNEMVSSTGTLTSIGLDRLPTPPPPPPTIITATASNIIILDKNTLYKKNSENKKLPHVKNNKTSKKQTKYKGTKAEKVEEFKASTEISKNIFSSLVSMKTRVKEQNKLKSSEKSNKIANKPLFNMYGSDSPQSIKQLPSFINENASPIVDNEPKNCLQSFSSGQKPKPQSENKLTFEKLGNKEKNQTNLVHESIDSVNTEMNNYEVPLKYAHKVTVTPIQRQSVGEQNYSLLTCRKTLFKESEQRKIKDTFDSKQINEEQWSYDKFKPKRPTTLQPQKPKAAARVLLDPEGKVVHCTNSLDRKIHYVESSERYIQIGDGFNQNGHVSNQNKEISREIKFYKPDPYEKNGFKPSITVHQYNESITRGHSFPANVDKTRYSPNAFETVKIYPNNPSTLQQYPSNLLHPHHEKNFVYKTDSKSPVSQIHSAQSLPRQKFQVLRKPHIVITPDPNILGLPIKDNYLTQHNVNLHSKQRETFNTSTSNVTNSTEYYLPSKQESDTSPNFNEVKKSPSTMSTEDLFAVIHNCKKRMNIKTDSDISLASSSRSNSPSCFQPVTIKGALAETGFLSPRNSSSLDSRDRRSWADFRPSKESCERKSLASDRLGPTKPTSMHDFKMLLLQTRSNSQVLGPRKSAVEMLKVPSPSDNSARIDPKALHSSSQSYASQSVPNSPSSEFYLYNGHSTVPFKRNNRARSTLQPRYTMYPPIFEEDSENRDMLQNSGINIDAHKNLHVQYNNSNIRENTSQDLSHWV